jgi:DNA-binding GntR family transcriptional regulator
MTQKKTPRHRAIALDLMQAVAAGRYAVGTTPPPETGLCDQLQASRHTVREALCILEPSGPIARRKGSGSEVIERQPAGAAVHRRAAGRRGAGRAAAHEEGRTLAARHAPAPRPQGARGAGGDQLAPRRPVPLPDAAAPRIRLNA